MAKKVYLKGEEFVFTKVKGSSETDYREGDVNINPTNIGLGSVNNTSDKDKPVSTAQQKAIDVAYANSNKYTDQKIANLINGAPETMDTLKEVSDAISASKSTEEALNKAIGTKANQTELDTHTGNDTIHITASERAKWNKNGGVTGIRGSAESDYKTGQVTISKENIGLGNVDNTADSNKSVKYATSAGSASTSDKVSNKLTIASPINSYNDLYFRDEIVTEAIQYDGSSAMTVNLMNVRSDSYQNTVKFTSNDSTIGDSTAPSLLKSGETHASIFSKVSTIFKNVRWLLSKMGTTDISTIGNGTVTGALSTLNSNIGGKQNTLDSPLFYRGTIKGDMNSYNTRSYNGYYYIATTTPPNAPASSGWSIVLVLFAYNDFGIQAIIKPTYNTFLLRERSGSPAQWSAWKKLALNITTN